MASSELVYGASFWVGHNKKCVIFITLLFCIFFITPLLFGIQIKIILMSMLRRLLNSLLLNVQASVLSVNSKAFLSGVRGIA